MKVKASVRKFKRSDSCHTIKGLEIQVAKELEKEHRKTINSHLQFEFKLWILIQKNRKLSDAVLSNECLQCSLLESPVRIGSVFAYVLDDRQ